MYSGEGESAEIAHLFGQQAKKIVFLWLEGQNFGLSADLIQKLALKRRCNYHSLTININTEPPQ